MGLMFCLAALCGSFPFLFSSQSHKVLEVARRVRGKGHSFQRWFAGWLGLPRMPCHRHAREIVNGGRTPERRSTPARAACGGGGRLTSAG